MLGDSVAAVVEDPFEVAADEEVVSDGAERSQRDRVADAVVDDGCVVTILLEEVGVSQTRFDGDAEARAG